MKKTVIAGMNTFNCPCGGVVFLPVTMRMMAWLRIHDTKELEGDCTEGHKAKVNATARFPLVERWGV